MIRVVYALLTGIALGTGFLGMQPLAQPATGATSENPLRAYEVRKDRFITYDFSEEARNREKVDFPVNLIFGHDADINKVKDAMEETYYFGKRHIGPIEVGASTAYARVNDGPEGNGGEWDADAGRKNAACQHPAQNEPNAFHFRVYAPPNTDHFVNQQWGRFIIATSHIDHNECDFIEDVGPDTRTWSGYSENAEWKIATDALHYFGARHVFRDRVYIGNYEPTEEEGAHIWQSNGQATWITVK
ncbi:MAG TPA: hypothetical protein VNP96_01705 [Solirubrobacterales bacterium]|nr:hypothetical protein [Solirubrobacterales bacterium]